jgi:capsular polysaccharide biosynthesis protein
MVEVARESEREIPELIPVHAAGKIYRKKPAIPIGCEHHPAFNIPEAPQTPTFLARLPQGRVVGPTVAVLTSADRMLSDVSLDWGNPGLEHFAYRRFRLPRCRDYQGSALILACTGADTYFHWLTDALPRLEIFAKASGIDSAPDWWVVNTLNRPFVRESLALLGIPLGRVVPLDKTPHVRFSELYVPSLPCEASTGDTPPWVAEFLRSSFLPWAEGGKSELPSYLWIDRGGHTSRSYPLPPPQRRVLRELGIEIVRPETMSFRDQIRLFSGVRVCLGPHGAGFTNSLFSQEPFVLEVFPPDRVNACYYSLSQLVGARYHYHVEGGVALLAHPRWEVYGALSAWTKS